MGFRVSACAGVWVCWCLGVFFSVHTCLLLLACLPACRALGACRPWVPAGLGCLPALPACLLACLPWGACPPALGACLRTLIRKNSLLSSFPVRSELTVLRSASAPAQESAICSQSMEGSRPALSRTASGAPQRFVQNTPVLHTGRILRLGDRRADGDVRRPGGPAKDQRSDNSCRGKLRAPHESEESCL